MNNDQRIDTEESPDFKGVKAILEFDLGIDRKRFLTASHAEGWRAVVEAMEFRLAQLETDAQFKEQRELFSRLLGELRQSCRKNEVQTELMREDAADGYLEVK